MKKGYEEWEMNRKLGVGNGKLKLGKYNIIEINNNY